MLTLLTGRAGTGKTAAVIESVKKDVEAGKPGSIILVPEQYSHEAERELARKCPDSASLYAEVLSFTGLARSLFASFGGNTAGYLDEGGKLLCMALSLVPAGLAEEFFAEESFFDAAGAEDENLFFEEGFFGDASLFGPTEEAASEEMAAVEDEDEDQEEDAIIESRSIVSLITDDVREPEKVP